MRLPRYDALRDAPLSCKNHVFFLIPGKGMKFWDQIEIHQTRAFSCSRWMPFAILSFFMQYAFSLPRNTPHFPEWGPRGRPKHARSQHRCLHMPFALSLFRHFCKLDLAPLRWSWTMANRKNPNNLIVFDSKKQDFCDASSCDQEIGQTAFRVLFR